VSNAVQQDPHAVQLFVDGSCFVHSKREAGYAGFVLYPDNPVEQQIVFNGFRQSTIPRMELAACIAAMEWLRQSSPGASRVQIFSDSRYVIDSVPRAPYWHRNKWRNAQGRPVEHSDLWKEFLSARSKAGVRVDFGWVKGKSSALLRKVDKTAKEAARSGTGFDRGYKAGKIGRPKTKGGASTMFPAAGQVVVVRVYGSRLVGSTDENKITFEMYDERTNQCGPKHFAYAQPEVGGELHRQRAFRVQMNDNPKYPQVLRVLEEIPIPKTKKTGTPQQLSTRTADSDSE
jgi:ribonuclease HI